MEKVKFRNLDEKGKKLINLCNKVETGRHCMGVHEVITFAKAHNNNLINGSVDIFNYGFIKGQRAMKAELKRKGVL